jgi:hypothetical protein
MGHEDFLPRLQLLSTAQMAQTYRIPGAAALVWIISPRKSPDTTIQKEGWLVSSSSYPDASSINPESPVVKLQLFREQDSFFGIPIRFWPWVLCGLGVISYFALGSTSR